MAACVRESARLLVVDDQAANVRLLERLLARAGYRDIRTTTDSSRAVSLCRDLEPDLLLLDLHMPAPDGFAILEQLEHAIEGGLPVIVLTADAEFESRRRALAAGARDFVTKPFEAVEVLLRIRNLLEVRALQAQLRERLIERTAELGEARLELLERLARAAEFRDDRTGEHVKRVGRTAALIAQRMGLPGETVAHLRYAAPLHDIGKIAISDTILLKPGRLTSEERTTVQRHVEIGAQILEGSRSPLLELAAEVALTHHEHWDGGGYLRGLRGEAIPVSGRITAVADVFDALVHERPYKRAWPIADAVAEIARGSGRQFCPTVVDAFMALDPASLVEPVVDTAPWTAG